MRKPFLLLLALLALPGPALAHYNMLFPQSPSVERGNEVKLTYQWGHPFEHELFDAPKPETVIVIGPDGKKKDLIETLKKVSIKAGKKEVTAYEIPFTPEEVGDYVFVLHTPPIWMAAEGEYYQDTVKVVLHVQAQKGWDHHEDTDLEFTPLTRPYGLVPGAVFQARLMGSARRGGGTRVAESDSVVEIERYNAAPPKELPTEELITRAVKTDPNGIVTCDLPDPGWWCLTATLNAGTKDHDGKAAPLRQRTTFWVHVAEKPRP